MTPAEIAAARKYLAPLQPAYWNWDEDRSAIAWFQGPTITLRQELAIVLASQPKSGRGLPELTAVLLLLTACRESWPQARQWVQKLLTNSGSWGTLPAGTHELLLQLDQIHDLAAELFQTATRKSELLAYLYADQSTRETSPEEGAAIVQLLAAPGPIAQLDDLKSKPLDIWQLTMKLSGALQKFDPANFLSTFKSGLEQEVLPAPVELELTSGQRVRALLTELNDDDELGGVARLARQLLAAITLPRPLAEPDDLPLGGVSDIANRGSLDRLLISELAHDDLTLAVRIATGEALYYRRETPPKSPPLRRMIVLDSGLRSWGVPRVFTTAIGLALAAAGDEKLAIEAFRASGSQLVPVDLTRKESLQQHLAALETDLHLGQALPAIQQAQELNAAGEQLPSDVVLITTDDALADEEFRKQLRAAALDSAWIAAINRDGRVRLLELGLREMVLKREARFELQSLLAPTRKPVTPLLTGDPKLPAFCRLKQCPLRLPHDLSVDRAWAIGEEGVLSIYKDHRLTWWDNPQYAPIVLADNMPRGRVLWADGQSQHMPYRAVVGTLSHRGMRAIQVWPREREVSSVQLKHDYPDQFTTVTGTAEHIFLIGPNRVVAFNWSGEELATSTQFSKHLAGRYFICGGPRFIGAISVTGNKIGLTAGYTTRAELPARMIAIAGTRESPQLLSDQGYVTDLLTNTDRQMVPPQFPRPFSLLAASRDGQRIAVSSKDTTQLLIHLENGSCQQIWGDAPLQVEPQVTKFLGRKVNLRQHFAGIYATAGGRLALCSRKGQELTIVPDPKFLLQDTGRSAVRKPQLRHFENIDAPSGYLLNRASWDDGSEAWLDSRGLLHLRSSNPTIPEMTLVLQEGELAGWSVTDGLFGNAYFTAAAEAVETPRPVRRALHSFVASLVTVTTT
jgi:hypothetical protein